MRRLRLSTMKLIGISKTRFRKNSRIARYCASHVSYFLFNGRAGPPDGVEIDRLRTIIGYDRICVLDAGNIAVSPRSVWCTGVFSRADS